MPAVRRPFELTDEQLAEQAGYGQQDAFAEIVRRYQARLVNLGYRMLGSREDAEDAAQEAFIKVYRNLPTFRPQERFATWLYKIATNVCIDRLRRRKPPAVSTDAPIGDDEDGLMLQLVAPDPSPEASAIRGEWREAIWRAVDRLPDNYRMAVLLRHMHDLSYEEIARILDWPLGTVKTRLFRAREALRSLLSEMEEDSEP